MIIFNLDTLADCEHRRHFVDWHKTDYSIPLCKWKLDYKSFYEASDKDIPIQPVISILNRFEREYEIEIWSARCESVRQKTLEWLFFSNACFPENIQLKMRPIGDNTPDHQLKEKWMDEASICVNELSGRIRQSNPIDFVFDSDPKSIEMWRRRGIFVFDCNQGKEF